jgi:hypothetical protein
MDPAWLPQLRAICLALPEASEQGGVGSPSFKVRDKIFAMQHPMDNRPSMWCKAPRGFQAALVRSDPERYFVPPYVGITAGSAPGWMATSTGTTWLI